MTPQSKVPVWLIGLILVGTILSCLSCRGPGWGGGYHRGGGYHHV
jgi:hypothetical protein